MYSTTTYITILQKQVKTLLQNSAWSVAKEKWNNINENAAINYDDTRHAFGCLDFHSSFVSRK